MIDETWMGEVNFDHDFSGQGSDRPMAIGVEMNSNDHYIQNSIVFAAKTGLAMHGAANLVSGLHVWFPFNKAKTFPYVQAFWVTGSQNRFIGCYVDAGRLVLEGSAQRFTWKDGFMLASILEFVGDSFALMDITDNTFEGGGISVVNNTASPSFKDMRVMNNIFTGNGTATTVTQSLFVP